MTGIEGLIPDPYYKAAVSSDQQWRLPSIHADFNHHKQMNLERRLNVLIYLNPDWNPEYGGAFEVWTDDMKERVGSVSSNHERMCCFSTSSTSMAWQPGTGEPS